MGSYNNFKEISREGFKFVCNAMLFRVNGFSAKLAIATNYFIIVTTSIAVWSAKPLTGVLLLFFSIAAMFLTYLLLYIIFESPRAFLFRDAINICKKIESIFKDDFYSYKGYLTDDKIPAIGNKLYKNRIPDRDILALWKYKLSTHKETSTLVLPIAGVILLALFDFPLKKDFLNYIQSIMNREPLNSLNFSYAAWMFSITAPIITFILYHYNIDRINTCLSMIDFIQEIEM